MRRKLPRELSKRNLIRDNSEMIGTIKYCRRVMEDQMRANIELSLNLRPLQEKYDALVQTIDNDHEEELHA